MKGLSKMEIEKKSIKDIVICYALICYHSVEQTINLIGLLTKNTNNIVIVHVDLKAEELFLKLKERFFGNKQVLFLEQRVSISWGDNNLSAAEFKLFEESLKYEYDYLKLLSESCLPVKSDAYIKLFLKEHPNKEFIECFKLNSQKWRVSLFHTHKIGKIKRLFPIISAINWNINLYFGKRIGNKDFINEDFYIGTNWVLLTKGCIASVVDYVNKNKLIDKFKYSLCSDEAIVQYAIMRTPYYNNIYNRERGGALNYSKWRLFNSPRVLTKKDIKEINKPDCLYARKFDLNFNRGFVESIYKINQK